MAEIKKYPNKKVNTEDDYDERLKRHKKKVRIFTMAIIVIVIIAISVVCLIRAKTVFNSYSVQSTVNNLEGTGAEYIDFDDGFLRCSKDGVSMYSYSGNMKWNFSFEMNHMAMDYCGEYVAIAGIGSNDIYIFNKGGIYYQVTTTLPILSVSIAEQGVVAAILEDAEATYIQMYDRDGEKLVAIKTSISGDGVPVSMALSDDGEKMIVSYTAFKESDLSTSVVFYNFGDVGMNESDRIVGGYDIYGSSIVAKTEFLGGNRAVAFGEKNISFFQVEEYPKMLKNIEIENQPEKIFYSDNYVGYVYYDSENEQNMCIYNTSGDKVLEKTVGGEYNSFRFSGKNIIMFGDNDCLMCNMKGKTIFSKAFDTPVYDIVTISQKNSFLFVKDGAVDIVKLK